MTTIKVTILVLLMKILIGLGQEVDYIFPNITVQALKPKGIRIWIPDDPGINLLYIEANQYRRIEYFKYLRSIRVFVVNSTDGRWMYEDRKTSCKIDDVFRCLLFVSLKRGIVTKDVHDHYRVNGFSNVGESIKITELVDPDAPEKSKCVPAITKVYGKTVCAGDKILEDNFDELREDLWRIEHYIPVDQPEHPFVSYQRLAEDPTISIVDGTLQIKPKLQYELPGFSNYSIFYEKLNLYNGCTNSVCGAQGFPIGVDILPPVVSGRISSRVAFTYGNVEIRAKMPIGDWLYTELLLEPFLQKYGTLNYGSGLLRIAAVCGNKQMNDSLYTNKNLRGIALSNAICRTALEHNKKMAKGTWSDEFHVYAVKWKPDLIEFLVDGKVWSRYKPGAAGLRSWMPVHCRGEWYKLLEGGGKMAPFDQHFFLTLGVAAGGTEFPDGLTTGSGRPKPWRNLGRKAAMSFWNDLQYWFPTWTQPLIIDYVRITAV